MSFKIGTIKILQMREKAKKELGDHFNIKDFHEIVLRSAGPLEIVEKQVDKGSCQSK